jgi:signal transduction histidine kinase/ligand-binding sensor domain-containing protein
MAQNEAHAIDPSKSLGQLNHATWTEKNGGPSVVYRMAQSADGMLWLGTRDGLYRFDGIQFLRLPAGPAELLPSSYISTVISSKRGGILVGHDKGITWLSDAGAQTYTPDNGLPAGAPSALVEREPGDWWAMYGRFGLYQFKDGRWAKVGKERGYPGARSHEMLVGANGTLWISAEDGVWYNRVGQTQFGHVLPRRINARLAQAPDGRVWGGGPEGLWYIDETQPDDVRSRLVSRSASDTLMFDRHGVMWRQIFTGLQRIVKGEDMAKLPEVPAPEVINRSPDVPVPAENMTPDGGLTSDVILSLLEDRDGNVWLGTTGGVERFRDQRLSLIELPRRRAPVGLAPATGGGVWAGNWDKSMMRWKDGQLTEFPELGTNPTMFHRDPQGDLWVSFASNGLFHERQGKFVHVDPPPKYPSNFQYLTQALASDKQGTVYVSFGRKDLYRLRDGQWTELTARLPADAQVRALFVDDASHLWIGTQSGVVQLDGETMRAFGAEQGLRIGPVSAFMQRHGRIWAGGYDGLTVLEGNAWRKLDVPTPRVFDGITAVLQSDDGAVWVQSKRGINRIDPADADAVEAGRAQTLAVETLDALDGLQGQPDPDRPLPTAIKADDGRLWFGTMRGAFWLDPSVRLQKMTVPAPRVDQVRVDGQVFAADQRIQLPPGTTQLVFTYAAANLSYPERVRYWFRLDGIDDEWKPAGTSREARYTNLKPGSYRFHVKAVDAAGGPGSGTETQLELSVLPAFYQTWWFRTLLVLAGLAVAWYAYRLHLNRRIRRAGELLQASLSERENIARELHDTLLQNVQALVLLFHAAAGRVTSEGGAQDAVHNCLSKAEVLIADGRRQIVGMRNEAQAVAQGLQPALEALAQDFSALSEARYFVTVELAEAELRPGVAEALYRVAREAMFNAARHARASAIHVCLSSGKGGVTLSVTDDGQGVPADVLASEQRTGHLGLPGMREWASKFDGVLAVSNLPGGGAAVTLEIPAARAYVWKLRSLLFAGARTEKATESADALE